MHMSSLAERTPEELRDDPVVHTGLEHRYEEHLNELSPTHVDRPRVLEALAHRYVYLEKVAFRDLVRACVAPDPRTDKAHAIRSAREAMRYGADGAARACQRMRAEYPDYSSRTICAAQADVRGD
jgi:hypothetical protein